MRLVIRLVCFVLYVGVGLIVSPLVGFFIFLASIPEYWKRTGKAKQVWLPDLGLTREDLGQSINIPMPQPEPQQGTQQPKSYDELLRDGELAVWCPNKVGKC